MNTAPTTTTAASPHLDIIYRCEDCGWTGDMHDMHCIDDLEQRVMPGELMAAGQCPKCRSLIPVDDEDVPGHTIEACIRIARSRGLLPKE